MTAATLSRLPLAAGGALAGSLARMGYWTLTRAMDFGSLVLAQFMRAPVAISTTFAIAGFSLLAGSNALYFQTARHPAPLFFPVVHHLVPAPVIRPVIPAVRPRFEPAVDTETTGSVRSDAAVDTIGSADVMALQRKLTALKLLNDPADGIFGRHTASALRAFEARAGMKPRGELTREALAAVLAAPLPDAVQPLPPAAIVAAAPTPPGPVTAGVTRAVASTVPVTTRNGPVPLAPLPTAAAVTVPVAAAPATPIAAATGTLSANSLPPARQAAPAAAALPPASASVASRASAPATGADSSDSARDDSSVVAMNSLPPAADGAPPAADAPPQTVAATAAAPAPADTGSTLTAAQKLAAQMGTLPPGATAATAVPAAPVSSDPGENAGSTDPLLITKIQRGLASLGFLGQKIDGVPGEGTAKAIRNFEVFYDYRVTGLATPQLLDLLIQHGAQT